MARSIHQRGNLQKRKAKAKIYQEGIEENEGGLKPSQSLSLSLSGLPLLTSEFCILNSEF